MVNLGKQVFQHIHHFPPIRKPVILHIPHRTRGLQWTPEEETMNTVILFVIDSVMKVLMEYPKCVKNERSISGRGGLLMHNFFHLVTLTNVVKHMQY